MKTSAQTNEQMFVTEAHEFVHWLAEKSLPVWASKGINAFNNASYEHLYFNGSVDARCHVRVRVQARQAFSFAEASLRGWLLSGGTLAVGLMEFAEKNTSIQQGPYGFAHLLNSDFEVIDTKWDLYNNAFFLLAYAKLYTLTQDEKYIKHAKQLTACMDSQIKSSHGGWAEGNYPHYVRRQNPHMHLFEAYLSLYESTGEYFWLEKVEQILALFEQHFFVPGSNVLLEFFNPDWSKLENARGQIVEPGHMLEWVWLLNRYQNQTGHSVENYFDDLYANGIQLGRSGSGLFYSEVSTNGRVINPLKRCWAMTEYIKASLVQMARGKLGALENARSGLASLKAYYLDCYTPGLYSDTRDADDAIQGSVAPASTLYHLVTLAAELDDYLGKVGRPIILLQSGDNHENCIDE